MIDWQIERISETPEGLRVDFYNDRTMQRVSGFFTRWSEPPHMGLPFTHAAKERVAREAARDFSSVPEDK